MLSFEFVHHVLILVNIVLVVPLGLPTIVACVPKLADDKVLVISCFHMGFELSASDYTFLDQLF